MQITIIMLNNVANLLMLLSQQYVNQQRFYIYLQVQILFLPNHYKIVYLITLQMYALLNLYQKSKNNYKFLKIMEKIFGNSILTIAQAQSLLSKYGSPLYLYDEQVIKKKAKVLTKAAQGFHISYAMKANGNRQILKILQQSGVPNVDVVSPGQMIRALRCGYKPNQILYTQNFISPQEITQAIKANVILNIGALDTIRTFRKQLHDKEIFIRINPQLGAGQTYQTVTGGPKSKFGVYYDQLQQLIKIAHQSNIHIIGLHQHIGSNLKSQDEDIFISTVKYIFQKSKLFPEVKYINIGGGVGINYRPQEKCMDINSLYDRVRAIKDKYQHDTKRNVQIWIQPGRFLVADCSVLLCKLTAKKKTPQRSFYGVDTGFNHLIRPALYGSHHEIYNLTNPNCQKQVVTVCGNICECSDNLGTQINLGGQIGDILCIENTGAYGFSMSSNYNDRLKPAQILKQGDTFRVIRRRQTYEDLVQKM